MKYIVELYNKDSNNYKTVFSTNDINIAVDVCKSFDDLCVKDMIIDRESVYTEPFDFAEVYDTEIKDVVYLR